MNFQFISAMEVNRFRYYLKFQFISAMAGHTFMYSMKFQFISAMEGNTFMYYMKVQVISLMDGNTFMYCMKFLSSSVREFFSSFTVLELTNQSASFGFAMVGNCCGNVDCYQPLFHPAFVRVHKSCISSARLHAKSRINPFTFQVLGLREGTLLPFSCCCHGWVPLVHHHCLFATTVLHIGGNNFVLLQWLQILC